MTDDQLNTAAFVFLDELRSWKKVSFSHDDCVAIRADTHEPVVCRDEHEAQALIERRAASALLRFYREQQSKAA